MPHLPTTARINLIYESGWKAQHSTTNIFVKNMKTKDKLTDLSFKSMWQWHRKIHEWLKCDGYMAALGAHNLPTVNNVYCRMMSYEMVVNYSQTSQSTHLSVGYAVVTCDIKLI